MPLRAIVLVSALAAFIGLAVAEGTPTATRPVSATGAVATELECVAPQGDYGGIVEAILSTLDGTPLPGQEIHWSDEPGLFTVNPETSTTDESGTAHTEYSVPADYEIHGNDLVTATFQGTASYGGSSCQVTIGIDAECPPSFPEICGYKVSTNQGDNDCDHDEDADDALVALRFLVGLDYSQAIGCLPFAQHILVQSRTPALPSGGYGLLFGDVNCDGTVDALDALAILRHLAAMPVSQHEPCHDIGTPL